jgi:hypothetical protein
LGYYLLVQNLWVRWCNVKISVGSSSMKTVPSCAKFKSPGDAAASPHLYMAPPMIISTSRCVLPGLLYSPNQPVLHSIPIHKGDRYSKPLHGEYQSLQPSCLLAIHAYHLKRASQKVLGQL